MDQQKAGNFLKQLRKEKGVTQEQLAERLGVSRRTVSRWETGSNMPDLDLLIELADYYDTDIRDILNGERKSEQMDKEMKDTVIAVADYANEDKIKTLDRFRAICIAGLAAFAIYFIMLAIEPDATSHLFDFIKGLFLGIAFGASILGTVVTCGRVSELNEVKRRIRGGKS